MKALIKYSLISAALLLMACQSTNSLKSYQVKSPATSFYLDKKFKGNENFIKVVRSSAFCSENNEIISDNYKITKDQKIAIIPPIGGG